MSTTNPDDVAKTIRHRLVPFALPIAIIGVLAPFVLFAINLNSGGNEEWTFVAFVVISVGAGLFGYYVIRPTAWVLAAYIVQYVGGLFLVLSSGVSLEDSASAIHQGFWIVAVPYAVAIWCLVMWALRRAAVAGTRARGVDTEATIESVGVDGQVNYVQHQRMTLSFTDTHGTKRFFRTGITGGFYDIGDKIPIRYDPDHPDSKRAIIVGGQPYVSPEQQP
ncbi:MAG TPA: DUF3592 domain-containing protein [Pseudolysinimonas sp.]|jgi:hypothetical protein